MIRPGYEYELLVDNLVGELTKSIPRFIGAKIGSAKNNRFQGVSGYKHQIDVSIKTDKLLILIECKHYSKKIGVSEILIMSARDIDIKKSNQELSTHSYIITTKGETRNVLGLKKEFGVGVDIVTSIEEYSMQIINKHFAANIEKLDISDFAEAEIKRL